MLIESLVRIYEPHDDKSSLMPICANDKCAEQAAHTLKAARAMIADLSVSLLIFSLLTIFALICWFPGTQKPIVEIQVAR